MAEKRAYVKNAADAGQVKEAGRLEQDTRKRELEDVKALMATPAGKRFIWRLINGICHVDALSANHSGSMTYLAEGERSVGRLVKSDVCQSALEAWQEMEREYWNERT